MSVTRTTDIKKTAFILSVLYKNYFVIKIACNIARFRIQHPSVSSRAPVKHINSSSDINIFKGTGMAHIARVCILFCIFLCPLSAQGKNQISLAVSDLAPQGVKESEAAIISEQLRVELSKSDEIQIIERSQMKEILKEQGFQQSGCTNNACAVEVGRLLGVKNIVIGSIGMAGSFTVLTVRVIDVSTGEIIVNEAVRTRGGIDKLLISGIQQASTKLKSGLHIGSVNRQSAGGAKLRKALLFGGGGTLLVGGGIAAFLLLNNEDNDNEQKEPNIEVTLP